MWTAPDFDFYLAVWLGFSVPIVSDTGGAVSRAGLSTPQGPRRSRSDI